MREETVAAETQQAEKGTPPPARRRFPIPMIIAAVFMFLAMASYFVNGVLLLFDLGVFTRGLGSVSVAAGALTPAGEKLALACAYLFFGALALATLVGFLLRRKWAWSAAMTWTALSLAVGLVSYFIAQPRYLSMLAGVILLLVLNQASLHREFRLEGR